MKKIFLLLSMVAIAAVGCKTDNSDHPHIDTKAASAPVVTPALQNVITLTKATGDSKVAFNWEAADYGFKAAIKYIVQMDKGDGTFEKPIDVATVDGTTASIKASAFNAMIVNQLKLDPDATVTVKIRIASFISDRIERIYSDEVEYYVNTYQALIIYPSLGVPGNYKAGAGGENWAPENPETRLWATNFDGKYESFIMMETDTPGKGLTFKFVDGIKWGDPEFVCPAPVLDGDTYTAEFVEGMGGDISGVANGFYHIKVDASATPKTLSMKSITSVGLTGACTTPEWSNDNAVELTYNFATYAWEAEVDLKAGNGEFLILLNKSWDIKYGKGNENGTLKAGGDNAVGPTDGGKYKIIVHLNTTFPTFEYIPL